MRRTSTGVSASSPCWRPSRQTRWIPVGYSNQARTSVCVWVWARSLAYSIKLGPYGEEFLLCALLSQKADHLLFWQLNLIAAVQVSLKNKVINISASKTSDLHSLVQWNWFLWCHWMHETQVQPVTSENPLGEMQRHVYIRIPVRALINLTGKGVKSKEIERRHPESVRSRAEIWKLQHQRNVEERRK